MIGKDVITKWLSYFSIDGFITTMDDAHLNEFVNDANNKIKFLTGFTGSAGMAFTSKTDKIFTTDGRYYLQAERELRDYKLVRRDKMDEYWNSISKEVRRVGIDTKYIGIEKYEKLKSRLNSLKIELVNVPDIVFNIWNNRKTGNFGDVEDLQEYAYEKEADIDKILSQLEMCSIMEFGGSEFNSQYMNDASLRERKRVLVSELSGKDAFNIRNRKRLLDLYKQLVNLGDLKSRIDKMIGVNDSTSDIPTSSIFPTDYDDKIGETSYDEATSIKENQKWEMYKRSIFDFSNVFDNNVIQNTGFGRGIVSEKREIKLYKIIGLLNKNEVLILTELDTIAWIFNLRGTDLPNSMVFHSFSIISRSRVILFANFSYKFFDLEGKEYKFEKRPYNEFYNFIEREYSSPLWRVVFSRNTPAFLVNKFKNFRITDDVRFVQSKKGKIELYGMLRAYALDSLALIRLFAQIQTKRRFTEKDVSELLIQLKSKNRYFMGLSFKTIASVGKNGAEIHHHPGSTPLTNEDTLLVDAGSYYAFGMTDITRTICLNPNESLTQDYTLVLKATIAPKLLHGKSITGGDVDAAARQVLGAKGHDYPTATGHGVGFRLNVHEGPPFIDRSKNELLENQVFTIEPGIYLDGKYGIRIEDTVYLSNSNGEWQLQDIAFVPYQHSMIDTNKLTENEKAYINKQNRKIRCLFSDYFVGEDPAFQYLSENTQEI